MSKALKPARLDVDPNSPNASKEWKHWKRTFDNFIAECGTQAPDKFRSIINFISADVFDYVEECTTYEEVIEVLSKLYVKTPNKIFARHKLASRKQKPGESLDEYLEELKKLSKDCKFEAVSAEDYRSEMIRDSFINGLSSNYIRQRLLENAALTLDEAHEKARTLDLAQRNSEAYSQQDQRPPTVAAASGSDFSDDHEKEHSLAALPKESKVNKSSQRKKSCYFCGGSLHANRASCPARDATCHNCSKVGHFAKVCQSATRNASLNAIYKPSLCAITAACPDNLNHASVEIIVYGSNQTTQRMDSLIDTCSSDTFISEKAFNKLGLKLTPAAKTVTMALTTMESNAIGYCYLTFTVNDQTYKNVKADVMRDLCSDIILGYDFQKQHHNVTFQYGGEKPDLIINPQNPKSRVNAIANEDKASVCTESNFANVTPPSLFKSIPAGTKPITTKSRFFNKDDRDFIKKEIESLLAAGVIKRSESPWRAQVLVAKDDLERHRKRLCIDYSQTVNLHTNLDAYPLPHIDKMVNELSKYKMFSTYDLKSAYHQIPLKQDEREFTAFECLGDLYEFCGMPEGVTNGVPCFQRIMDELVEEENLKDTFPYLDNVTIGGRNEIELEQNDQAFRNMIKKRNITLNESKTVKCSSVINILGHQISHKSIKPDPERLRPLLEFPQPSNFTSLRRVLGMFAYYAKWIPQYSDKIKPLFETETFPLNESAIKAFNSIKSQLGEVVLQPINEDIPFVVECDASDVAISASLNQDGRPVAFMSRTLSKSERWYPAVEKEALSIVEAVRKWNHLLSRQSFTLITDQRSVSYMFDNRKRTKIKNSKIQTWRLELAEFSYTIQYRQGKQNVVADSFTRAHCNAISSNLEDFHVQLCHPEVTRLLHFVKTRNLPFSTEEVKRVCSHCRICSELKPRFYKSPQGTLIKATKPMERLGLDFKGPLPSVTRNKYLLTIIDEYSRFPFGIPCPDMNSGTVIKSLDTLFTLCGMPGYVHSDRGKSFMSKEIVNYLTSRNISSSHSTPYHPIGNGQVERYNGIIWKSVRLALASKGLAVEQWEKVLPDALHSIRSLLSTATNETPHDRFFNFQRKSSQGASLPSWLSPGPVFLRKFVRSNKQDDLVEEVELTHVNPKYAYVRHRDGRESTVSLSDLAPCPRNQPEPTVSLSDLAPCPRNQPEPAVADPIPLDAAIPSSNECRTEITFGEPVKVNQSMEQPIVECDNAVVELGNTLDKPVDVVNEGFRRSSRVKRKPQKYGFDDDY